MEQLREYAINAGHTMLGLAFGWLLSKPVTASVIAGASTPEQIEQNVKAGSVKLSSEQVAELDRITS